jgi:hypothetical protein
MTWVNIHRPGVTAQSESPGRAAGDLGVDALPKLQRSAMAINKGTGNSLAPAD